MNAQDIKDKINSYSEAINSHIDELEKEIDSMEASTIEAYSAVKDIMASAVRLSSVIATSVHEALKDKDVSTDEPGPE